MTDFEAPPPSPDEPELPWPVAPRPSSPPPPAAPPGLPPESQWYSPVETWPSPRPASPWPTAPTRTAPLRHRALGLLVAVAFVALLAGTAVGIAVTRDATTSSGPGLGGLGSNSSGNGTVVDEFGSSSSASGVDIDVRQISESVSPAVVNIATTLTSGNQTAGSGVVITKSGLVITNNHVINGAERIDVEIGVTGETYTADVLGYDVEDDVALIKLNDASNMTTIKTADSSTVSHNDEVVAIGNALGRFGEPSVVAGRVTALHQSITAGDGLDRESLEDMIRIAASIQPGDSGGALVNADGRVIGINTAADAGSGRFGYQAGTTGFAIPIENALGIAHQIRTGDSSNGVHIGDRALLGVVLSGPGEGFQSTDGAEVTDVGDDTPAADAGIDVGDTITAVDGHPVGSGEELRSVLHRYHPGDRVRVAWTDSSGDTHRATVTLIKGPPA